MYVPLVKKAQMFVANHLSPGDVAVDATVGNGYDTQFLAAAVGRWGHVYGFDVQNQALLVAKKRLENADLLRQVTLLSAGHECLLTYIPEQHLGQIKAVMFNLGYLPGSNKEVVTQAETTLPALDNTCEIIAGDGIISIVAYTAHTGGQQELQAVATWLNALDKKRFDIKHVKLAGPQEGKPQLFILSRSAD